MRSLLQRNYFRVRLYFADNTFSAFAVNSWTTVGQLIKCVASACSCANPALFTLYSYNDLTGAQCCLAEGDGVMHTGVLPDNEEEASRRTSLFSRHTFTGGSVRGTTRLLVHVCALPRAALEVIQHSHPRLLDLTYKSAVREVSCNEVTTSSVHLASFAALSCQIIYGRCPWSRQEALILIRRSLPLIAPTTYLSSTVTTVAMDAAMMESESTTTSLLDRVVDKSCISFASEVHKNWAHLPPLTARQAQSNYLTLTRRVTLETGRWFWVTSYRRLVANGDPPGDAPGNDGGQDPEKYLLRVCSVGVTVMFFATNGDRYV